MNRRRGEAVEEVLRREGLVKVCGLREPEHAVSAVVAGADLLGFVFAPARRRVTPEQARHCVEAARRFGHRDVLAVGVFVDASPTEISDTVEAAMLDLVQLHGNEPPEFPACLSRPAMKALKFAPGGSAEGALAVLQDHAGASVPPLVLLVDGHHPTLAGGAGVRADWAVAATLGRRYPILLAGGLDEGNVAAAIAAVRPRGVDVSSGVERDGVKDPERIGAFVAAARAAFGDANGRGDAARPGGGEELGRHASTESG